MAAHPLPVIQSPETAVGWTHVPPARRPATPSAALDATAYRRAHTGRLMIIQRAEGRALAASDFFQFDAVGTHPTGLFVTGLFENDRRSHMLASAVRDATPDEIAWHTSRL